MPQDLGAVDEASSALIIDSINEIYAGEQIIRIEYVLAGDFEGQTLSTTVKIEIVSASLDVPSF